jgi:hypothetical protein
LTDAWALIKELTWKYGLCTWVHSRCWSMVTWLPLTRFPHHYTLKITVVLLVDTVTYLNFCSCFFFFLCDSFSCMVDSGTQKRVIVGWFGAKSPFAWCPNYATFHSCREIYPMASFIFRAAKFFNKKFTCAIVYISSSIFSMHKLLAGLEFCHEGISVLHICFAFFFDCL